MFTKKNTNTKGYGKLLSSIREQHLFKIEVYLKSLIDAYKLLSSHTINKPKQVISKSNITQDNGSKQNHGVSYLQTQNPLLIADRQITPHMTCFKSNRKGRYLDNWPTNKKQKHIQTIDYGIGKDT